MADDPRFSHIATDPRFKVILLHVGDIGNGQCLFVGSTS